MDEFRALQDNKAAQTALINEYIEEKEIRRSGVRIGQKAQAAIFANASRNIKAQVSILLFSDSK